VIFQSWANWKMDATAKDRCTLTLEDTLSNSFCTRCVHLNRRLLVYVRVHENELVKCV
jgi:hypothetical protein